MGSMFPSGKEPLPFETASDRLATALEQFGQPKATVGNQADHVMTSTEAEVTKGPLIIRRSPPVLCRSR